MSIPWRALGPAIAVGVAVVAGIALTQGDDPTAATTTSTTTPAPVAVTSDAPVLYSLDALVAESDVIVRGVVTTTERGRLFGDPGSGTAIESRLVTLSVTRVLRGDAPAGDLLVEEEGWTQDGAPLVVDGAEPSQPGDDGIWFLTEVQGPEGPAYVIVSAQGRYLVDGDRLRGAAGDDPLIAELSDLSADELAERVTARPG
jgi:hypothetical protein